MNIELNISIRQNDVPPSHLQRIRRVINVLQDMGEVTLTFADKDAPERKDTTSFIKGVERPNPRHLIILSKQSMAFPLKYQ